MNYNKKWREANPEKTKAHWTVQNHLKNGRITKQPCEICGEAKVHAHHDDYTKPLEIKWLCNKCHVDAHHGVDRPNKKKYKSKEYIHKPNPLINEAKSLREQGKTYQQIADQLGYSKGHIYAWINYQYS